MKFTYLLSKFCVYNFDVLYPIVCVCICSGKVNDEHFELFIQPVMNNICGEFNRLAQSPKCKLMSLHLLHDASRDEKGDGD